MNQKVSLPGEAQAYNNVTVSAIDGVNHGFVPTGFGKPSSAVPGNPVAALDAPEVTRVIPSTIDNPDAEIIRGKIPAGLIRSSYKEALGQHIRERDFHSIYRFSEALIGQLNDPKHDVDNAEWLAGCDGWERNPGNKRLLVFHPNRWQTLGKALSYNHGGMFVHRLMNEHREEMEYRIKVAELAFNYPDRFALAMRADVDSWMSITCANIDEPGERMYHILNHVLVNGSFIIKDLTSTLSVVMPDRKVEDMHEQLITNTSIKRIRFV